MRSLNIALAFASLIDASSARSDELDDAMSRDLTILRQTLEEPLRVEFLHRGLTPRNAAVASKHVLDKLAECWSSDRNTLANYNSETMAVRIGDQVIVTYASPCIDELADRVADLKS